MQTIKLEGLASVARVLLKPALTLLPLIVCAASLYIFFRVQIQSSFGIVFGERTDGLIEITLLEHWRNVIFGYSDFRTAFFFYPVTDTLGYNDSYFIFGLIYSSFRALGADPLLASDLNDVAVKAIGFFSTYSLLMMIQSGHQRVAHNVFANFGALLFTIANSTYVNAYHAQLFSVCFVPLFVFLLLRMNSSFSGVDRRNLIVFGTAAALLFDAWLITAFYMAWFTVYFGVILTLVLVTQTQLCQLRLKFREARLILPGLIMIFMVGLLGLAPFVLIYGPTASETGMHSFAEVRLYLPSLLDAINVGPNNLIHGFWDKRLAAVAGTNFPLGGEHVMGITPVMLVMALIGAFVQADAIWRFRTSCLGIAILISWLLTIHIGTFSFWRLIYPVLPGAKAVRVISRFEIFLLLPIVVLVVNALSWILEKGAGSRYNQGKVICIILMLSGLLVAEQINGSWPLALQRPEEVSRVAALPQAPHDCVAFIATHTRRGAPLQPVAIDQLYSHNVDAMFIAEMIRLPTLNGMASFMPKGWNLANPEQPNYVQRAEAFAANHGVSKFALCKLDLRSGLWSR